MPFCQECSKRSTCKEICKGLNKELNKKSIRGYSKRHIIRKERLFPTNVLERIAAERAFKMKYGKKYGEVRTQE